MKTRWVRRREHNRRLASGKVVTVRDNIALYHAADSTEANKRSGTCPDCGAKIGSLRMPNGGWVHYEAGHGRSRIKHPCFHRGEGLPKGRDTDTLELFRGTSFGVAPPRLSRRRK